MQPPRSMFPIPRGGEAETKRSDGAPSGPRLSAPRTIFITGTGRLGIELGVDHETMSMLVTNIKEDGAIRRESGYAMSTGDVLVQVADTKLPTSFDVIDQDHDGNIDASEIEAAFAVLGHPIHPSDAAALVQRYDTDNNGSISKEEFFDLARDRLLNIVVEIVGNAARPLRLVVATPDHGSLLPEKVEEGAAVGAAGGGAAVAAAATLDASLGFTAGLFVPLAAADLELVWAIPGAGQVGTPPGVVPMWVTPETSSAVITATAAAAPALRDGTLPSKIPPPGATELVFVYAADGTMAWRHGSVEMLNGSEPAWRNPSGTIVEVRGALRTQPCWRSVANGMVTAQNPTPSAEETLLSTAASSAAATASASTAASTSVSTELLTRYANPNAGATHAQARQPRPPATILQPATAHALPAAPAVGAPAASADDEWYYTGDDGGRLGPYALSVLHGWFMSGHFALDETIYRSTAGGASGVGTSLEEAFLVVGLSAALAPAAERRVAPDGNGPYTRDEFIQFYGGTAEWDAGSSDVAAPADGDGDSEPY